MHTLYIQIRLELKLWTNKRIADTQTFLVLLRGIRVQCLSCWVATRHKWAPIGLYFDFVPVAEKQAEPIGAKFTFSSWKPCFFFPPFITIGLDWTSKANKKPGIADDIFCRFFLLKHLAVRPTAPFLCQYYSRNTDCLQPMAPHSQTTILDERWSIHCNSSCLYNRCGSTDVYVLYSRVHFYYLQIKDCVEEERGLFEPSAPRLLFTWWLKAHVICWMWFFFLYVSSQFQKHKLGEWW